LLLLPRAHKGATNGFCKNSPLTFHAAMSRGKFQGMICPTTPSTCPPSRALHP
jgi:hypothetical protein